MQACILPHPRGYPADDMAASAGANVRDLLENIVRISGERIAAHYRLAGGIIDDSCQDRPESALQ